MKNLMLAIAVIGVGIGSLYAATIGPLSYDDSGSTLRGSSIPYVVLRTLTLAQMNADAPTAAGQPIFVSNATQSALCISTGTGAGAYVVAVATGSFILGPGHCN